MPGRLDPVAGDRDRWRRAGVDRRALADPGRPGRAWTTPASRRCVTSVAGETDDLLFAPWLSGERVPLFDDSARGAFVGLALRHGRAHLVRAVMEGVAYQIRWALRVRPRLRARARRHPGRGRRRHG